MRKKLVKYLPSGDMPELRRTGVKVSAEPVSRPFAAMCAAVSVIGIAAVLAGKIRKIGK